jgi:exodeoxyribonuclease VII large subunit
VAHGRVDVFDQQGVYQLYVTALQPAGFGDLALRYEALKARLAAEGLFDQVRKRPLPIRPRTIAVVTSPSGAVWHDIRTVLERRWPMTRVLLAPCQVQGDGAPASIVKALELVGRWIDRAGEFGETGLVPEVTILARGGGSLEDLWPFNDERVVRAVVAHPVPVVCGVGHEVDVTLADFAADVRAPTPSAAAEVVTLDQAEVARGLAVERRRLDALVTERLDRTGRRVSEERRALDRLSPDAQLAAARERAGLLLDRATRTILGRVDGARRADERARERLAPIGPARVARSVDQVERSAVRLPAAVRARLVAATAALQTGQAALQALGPQATLERGYAIVRRTRDGLIVRDPVQAGAGERLALRVAHGELVATSDGPVPATTSDQGPSAPDGPVVD